jgi:hypothetical protein
MYTTDYNQALPLGQRPRPLSLPALRAESLYQLYYPTYKLPPRTVGPYQGQRSAEKSGRMAIQDFGRRTVAQLSPEHYRRHRQQLTEKGTVKKRHADSTKENVWGVMMKWTR